MIEAFSQKIALLIRGHRVVVKPRLWYVDDFLRLPPARRSLQSVQFSCWKREADGSYRFAIYRLDRVQFYVHA